MSNCTFFKTYADPYTLDEIMGVIQSGDVSVGNYFTCRLNDGNEVELVVTDIEADAVRLETRDCLGKYVKRYEEDLEAFFNAFRDNLPVVIREAIIPTTRKAFDAYGKEVHTNKMMFLPAASEIFAPDNCYGDQGLYQQMNYYKDPRNRIRLFHKGGEPDWYWTDSRYSGGTVHWCNVNHNGSANSSSASTTWIAAPVCFRVRKS